MTSWARGIASWLYTLEPWNSSQWGSPIMNSKGRFWRLGPTWQLQQGDRMRLVCAAHGVSDSHAHVTSEGGWLADPACWHSTAAAGWAGGEMGWEVELSAQAGLIFSVFYFLLTFSFLNFKSEFKPTKLTWMQQQEIPACYARFILFLYLLVILFIKVDACKYIKQENNWHNLIIKDSLFVYIFRC